MTTESDDLPFDIEAVKASFKNVKHIDVRNKKMEHCRNGTYKKTAKSTAGKVEIEVPRDRGGSFEPLIVPKFESQTSDLEAQIISFTPKV